MSFSQNIREISQSWIEMKRKFTRSYEEWSDDVREQLEHEYFQEISHVVPEYLQALEDLEEVVEQARRSVK